LQRTLRELRRFEQFLADTVADDMRTHGQTERRAGDVVYELRAEATWVVDDPGALFQVLHDGVARDEITRLEFDDAVQQVVEFTFHQGKLNSLARRLPQIDKLRRRVEGESRLRQKK